MPTPVISCHADTGFPFHRLKAEVNRFTGHLDNFAGVCAVMTACFSGRMDMSGDDNRSAVSCSRRSIETAAAALIRIARGFSASRQPQA